MIARHFYRPSNPAVLRKHAARFPEIELFPVTALVRDWDEAQQTFFAERGVFDQIYQSKGK